MGVEKNLSDALGIEYEVEKQDIVSTEKKDIIEYIPLEEKDDQKEDYELVRSTLRNLIEKGNDSLNDIIQIAKENESARGFEVVANLIKTVGETSKDLYNLQKIKKEIRDPDKKEKLDETNITVDKAVFVGTTAELLTMMKEKEKNND